MSNNFPPVPGRPVGQDDLTALTGGGFPQTGEGAVGPSPATIQHARVESPRLRARFCLRLSHLAPGALRPGRARLYTRCVGMGFCSPPLPRVSMWKVPNNLA